MTEPHQILKQLGLTPAEIDIYIAFLNGAQTARDVTKTTDRTRPTVYYALASLERRGLVRKLSHNGGSGYRIEPIERLETIIDERERELKHLRHDVATLSRATQPPASPDVQPEVLFYQGAAAVRHIVLESMYCHSRQIDTIVPQHNFFWQLGRDFVEEYVELRNNAGITTRSLWEEEIEQTVLDEYYEKSEVRTLPPAMHDRFQTTIFLFDNKVLYISSLKNSYCFMVVSEEHRQMMQAVFDTIWSISRKVK
jgi:HTH-type transcriptional regulator, sugar sensing transcriptional regulator